MYHGIAIAVVGLCLLCIQGNFTVRFSDTLLLLCAFCFAVRILVIDHYADKVDGVRRASTQEDERGSRPIHAAAMNRNEHMVDFVVSDVSDCLAIPWLWIAASNIFCREPLQL